MKRENGILWVVLVGVCWLAFVCVFIFSHAEPIRSDKVETTFADVETGETTLAARETEAVLSETESGVQVMPETETPVRGAENERETYAETETEIVGSVTETEPVEVAAEVEPVVRDADAVLIAKTINVEAPYCSTMEQAAVAWCILNRVDDPRFPATVYENVSPTSPRQFGYYPETILRDDLYALALDVLARWEREKNGEVDVGRVLPREYLYFWGDGVHNHFRVNERDQVYWDWSWGDPYA